MIEVEQHAEPDDWEVSVAEFLSELGCSVFFQKRSLFDHDRMCDSLVNNLRWDLKNPTGNGYLTIHNQLIHNLYGQDKHLLDPQSSRVLISNIRNGFSLGEMNWRLRQALQGDTGLSEAELACIHAVALVDMKTRQLCGYVKSHQVSPESPPGSLLARYKYTTVVQEIFGVGDVRR